MAQKKNIYESNIMALPPLRLVLGDVPSPDPEIRRTPVRNPEKPLNEMEVPIRKLIAHLSEDKKG